MSRPPRPANQRHHGVQHDEEHRDRHVHEDDVTTQSAKQLAHAAMVRLALSSGRRRPNLRRGRTQRRLHGPRRFAPFVGRGPTLAPYRHVVSLPCNFCTPANRPEEGHAMTTTTTDDAVQVPRAGQYAIDSRGSTLTFRSRHLLRARAGARHDGHQARPGRRRRPDHRLQRPGRDRHDQLPHRQPASRRGRAVSTVPRRSPVSLDDVHLGAAGSLQRPLDAHRHVDRSRRCPSGEPGHRAVRRPARNGQFLRRLRDHPHRPDRLRPHRSQRDGRAPPRRVATDPGVRR